MLSQICMQSCGKWADWVTNQQNSWFSAINTCRNLLLLLRNSSCYFYHMMWEVTPSKINWFTNAFFRLDQYIYEKEIQRFGLNKMTYWSPLSHITINHFLLVGGCVEYFIDLIDQMKQLWYLLGACTKHAMVTWNPLRVKLQQVPNLLDNGWVRIHCSTVPTCHARWQLALSLKSNLHQISGTGYTDSQCTCTFLPSHSTSRSQNTIQGSLFRPKNINFLYTLPRLIPTLVETSSIPCGHCIPALVIMK